MTKRNLSRNQMALIRTRLAEFRTALAVATFAVAALAAMASLIHAAPIIG